MENWNIDLSSNRKFDYRKYILSKELSDLIQVALTLDQPILLTGEPGTGKTLLAYKIAYDLSKSHNEFIDTPFVFNTKTTSSSSDLFYLYDAVRHFYDANISKSLGKSLGEISDYIELQALGKAIAMSNESEVNNSSFIDASISQSSVVLIDEVDKAPRDFPNDILHEIDKFEFQIKEAHNHTIKKGENQKILIIMTSNSEKNLPDAFLRRCLFYHIPFPDKNQLSRIIEANINFDTKYSDESLIDFFLAIRKTVVKKKPATAELLSWLQILNLRNFINNEALDFNNLSEYQKRILRLSVPILVKTTEDLDAVKHLVPV